MADYELIFDDAVQLWAAGVRSPMPALDLPPGAAAVPGRRVQLAIGVRGDERRLSLHGRVVPASAAKGETDARVRLEADQVEQVREHLGLSAPSDARWRYVRHARRVDLHMGVELMGGDEPQQATLLDLSAGGMRLSVREPLEPGVRVAVRIPVPQQPLTLVCEVAWSSRRERVAGLRFFEPGDELLVRIEALVAWFAEREDSARQGQPPRVLVALRQPNQIEVAVAALKASGYQLEFANDGPGALLAIRRSRPDVVLLDPLLTVIDGVEIGRLVHDDVELRRTVVLLVSVLSEQRGRQIASLACAAAHLALPLDTKALLAQLAEFGAGRGVLSLES